MEFNSGFKGLIKTFLLDFNMSHMLNFFTYVNIYRSICA